jgi:hypothetical protein
VKKFAKVPLSEIQVQDDYSQTLIKALKKNRKLTSKTQVGETLYSGEPEPKQKLTSSDNSTPKKSQSKQKTKCSKKQKS